MIRLYHPNGNLFAEIDRKFDNAESPTRREWDINGELTYESWWLRGIRHSFRGAAIKERICGVIQKSYYVHGDCMTKEEYKELMRPPTIEAVIRSALPMPIADEIWQYYTRY